MTPDVEATERASAKYLPEPARQRKGIALCLSGGGYRAALFHLGALRRLNELGILSQIDTISSVSGGSIVSAFLCSQVPLWPAPGSVIADFDQLVSTPITDFTSRNIRTWPLLRRLIPWDRKGAVESLAKTYQRQITPMLLRDLPERPRFIFCATDMSFGVNWVFEKHRLGDYQAGYAQPSSNWAVARAVAASSCFPPIFNPMRLGHAIDLQTGKARGPDRNQIVEGLRLSDGGVYDNMGLEPVWKSHKVVLVSDGGATFDFGPDRGLLWRLQRYSAVVGRQASAMRKRWLISGFLRGELSGAYWGIGSAASSYGKTEGYSSDLVDQVVSEIRTDLDGFSVAEKAVLVNHGYGLADAAISRHVPELIGHPGGASIPHPEWTDEDAIRPALSKSGKQSLLGRF